MVEEEKEAHIWFNHVFKLAAGKGVGDGKVTEGRRDKQSLRAGV